MRQISILFFLFCLISSSVFSFTPGNDALNKFLKSGEYFDFREEYIRDSSSMNSNDKHYYKAFYESWFGSETVSDNEARTLLRMDMLGMSDSLKASLYFLQFNNAFRTFRYNDAADAIFIINKRYKSVLHSEEQQSVGDISPVIEALRKIPAQTMERDGDLDIKYKRDIAALIRLRVSVNGFQGKFIFDTGANLSTICESEAKRMKLRMLDAKIGVTSSSQKGVSSGLGVADTLRIGNIVFHNIVFLVMPDKSLKFAGGLYKIKGIIGLPVIAMMGNIEIKDDKHLKSYSTAPLRGVPDLGFEGNTVFARAGFYGQYHAYVFDTGAATTIFSLNFRNAYSDSIPATKENSSHVGGAGGVQKVSNIPLKNVHYELGGKKGIMKRTAIQVTGTLSAFGNYYGILGENIFMQYKTMYINFDTHSIELGEPVGK